MNGLSLEDNKKLMQYKGGLQYNYCADVQKLANGKPIIDSNGKALLNSGKPLLEIIDTRELELEKLKYISSMWCNFNEFILEAAPLYVQANAAMGLLSKEETESMKSLINLAKSEFDSRKNSILNAKTCDEVVIISQEEWPKILVLAKNALLAL